MNVPYAEVIGDPIAHSKSPLIHKFWLEALRLEGDYRAFRVHHNDLGAYFTARRGDPDWRGCNVSLPHKIHAIRHLDDFTAEAVAVGAVNCVYRKGDRLVGANTDVDGVDAVLDARPWRANMVTIIGGGGAARAVLEVLRRRDVLEVFMIVRDPGSVRPVHAAFVRSGAVHDFRDTDVAFAACEYLINASPLGMAGAPAMPASILGALGKVARYATVFDMVYTPPETQLLTRARALSLATSTGIDMLVGQARSAFRRFFGREPPEGLDAELIGRLTQ